MNVERIIAQIPGKSEAERGQMRANAERWLAGGTKAQMAAAKALIEALDAQAAAEKQSLVGRLNGMARAERVVEAFQAVPMTANEAKVIRALLDHPGSTSAELSAACGWQGLKWQLEFGTLCRKRESYLWPAEYVESRDAGFYSGILADLEPPENRFTMKPDVAEAFRAMGLGPKGTAR